jgi:hypothetical protein
MQIERTGTVHFNDASLNVWESPGGMVMGAWENEFKKAVFLRIVQQLNRMGWTCIIPEEMIKRYGMSFARSHRYCRHGDVEAELSVSGRHIELKMYQNVQNVDNRNGGQYCFDKEERMTYQQRLRMHYTRLKLRDYLCSVFSRYTFEPDRHPKVGPGKERVTAMEWMQKAIRATGHYREELGRASISMKSNETARDGGTIKHGATIWYHDWKTQRIFKGTAFYDLNASWFVVSGRYGHSVVQASDIYSSEPLNLRRLVTAGKRRKKIEGLMQRATASMDFERAAKLRDILFPKDEPLFMIWSDKHGGGYFGPNYSGYTTDTVQAGKYTRAELKPYLGSADEKAHLRAVPVRAA